MMRWIESPHSRSAHVAGQRFARGDVTRKVHLRMFLFGVIQRLASHRLTLSVSELRELRVALKTLFTLLIFFAVMRPAVAQHNIRPVLPHQAGSVTQAQFVPGAFSGQVAAQHSPNVQQLLKSQYKLEVERRHSQLLITRRNVRRLAVTDSGICNYVQYSPTELAIVGLQLGTTDLMIWFEGEAFPAIYEITVVRDENLEEQRQSEFARLERRLSDLFPNSNVYLVPVGAQVLVKGQAYDPEEAAQILQIVRSEVRRTLGQYGGYGQNTSSGNNIQLVSGQSGSPSQGLGQFQDIVVNMLDVPGEYNVKMRVVIAEISRSQLRDMGVDWNALFNSGRHSVGAALGGATGTTLSGIFENGQINVLIRWLTTNGTATLLAEPTIVCMSGHSASLLAGGEFAVPTIIGLGGGQATSFRGIGTSMVVTPTVMDRDLIRMQIVPEFSAIDGANSVNGIPGTTVKRVQTTVELREGQTLALGGLISRQATTTISRIPLLGDIPFIGSRLFHTKNANEDEVELLVLVTPEIVRPMEPDEVPPLPNYYVTHPNDHDLFKYGRSEGSPDTTVYQTQPFGTGMNHGIPSGYSLQDANLVPQLSMPQAQSVVPPDAQFPARNDSRRLNRMPQPDARISPQQSHELIPVPMTPRQQQKHFYPQRQLSSPPTGQQSPLSLPQPIPIQPQAALRPASRSNVRPVSVSRFTSVLQNGTASAGANQNQSAGNPRRR